MHRADQADDAVDIGAETFLVAWRRIDEVPDPVRYADRRHSHDHHADDFDFFETKIHVHRLLFEVWLDGAFGLVAPPAGAPPRKAWRCQTIRLPRRNRHNRPLSCGSAVRVLPHPVHLQAFAQ